MSTNVSLTPEAKTAIRKAFQEWSNANVAIEAKRGEQRDIIDACAKLLDIKSGDIRKGFSTMYNQKHKDLDEQIDNIQTVIGIIE